MSIVEDFAGIRSRLEEIEKKPAAKVAEKSLSEQAAAAIANSSMYYVPENDTAPSEYIF